MLGSFVTVASLSQVVYILNPDNVKVLFPDSEHSQVPNFPSCVDRHSPFIPGSVGYDFDEEYGQHSGPKHFIRALLNSSLVSQSVHRSRFIYINLNCMYRLLLAATHNMEGEVAKSECHSNMKCPFETIQTFLSVVMRSPRWLKNAGRDFIIYAPHPLQLQPWSGVKTCKEANFRPILVVPEQIRCLEKHTYDMLIHETIIAPYHSYYSHYDNWNAVNDRKYLLTAHAGCVGNGMRGKIFSSILEHAVTKQPLSISCRSQLNESEYAKVLFASKFCLILPGDTQSSKRLSDVVLSGCIPTFVGPPFHTLPFSDAVAYEDAALFFHVNNHTWYESTDPQQRGFLECDVMSPKCWFDTALLRKGLLYHVNEVADIVPLLESMLDADILRLRAGLSHSKPAFIFSDTFRVTGDLSAEGQIMASLLQISKAAAAKKAIQQLLRTVT